jgi:hypothetical protein
MRRIMQAALAAGVTAIALACLPGTANAEAPAKKLTGKCSVSIDGERYTAKAALRHTGGESSAYYVSRFKTSGPPIASARFTLFQAFEGEGEPAPGFPGEISGITELNDLKGNTAYFLPSSATGHAVVYVTENESLNGDPREKVARLRPFITVGDKTAACWIVFEQP